MRLWSSSSSPTASSSALSASSSLTYMLGTSLYVPLTSWSNTVTLPATRGPRFQLPTATIHALCRLRAREEEGALDPSWPTWTNENNINNNNNNNDSTLYGFLPPRGRVAHVVPNDDDGNNNCNDDTTTTTTTLRRRRLPTVEEYVAELEHHCLVANPEVTAIVVAGEGEPLLRFDTLMQLLRELQAHPQLSHLPRRLTTNGLWTAGAAPIPTILGPEQQQNRNTATTTSIETTLETLFLHGGLDRLSVALQTDRPDQYDAWMQPVISTDKKGVSNAHSRVCRWIQYATALAASTSGPPTPTPQQQQQRQNNNNNNTNNFGTNSSFAASVVPWTVEVTAVARPDVDREATEALAGHLGVTQPVRWRSYHP